jgi:hypothetical protein
LPFGFGVENERALRDLLVDVAMSPGDADCVAREAFATNPSTERYADGSYDIPRVLLVAAGDTCGIDWSDYDFTHD